MIFYLTLLLTGFIYVNGLDNGLALTPPMGWTTWCTNKNFLPCEDDFCNEAEIKSVMTGMIKNGLRDLGYNYILLDDCWAATKRTAAGQIAADRSRFPSGTLAPLAQFAHENGFKVGAYTDVGEKTCRNNRTGSGGHFLDDARTFASWKLDGVKADWCNHGTESAEQLYSQFSQALNSTGRPMLFMACEWGLFEPWKWAPKWTNTYRISGDHLPIWWTPKTSQDPGVGQGTANLIQHAANKSQYAGRGHWNSLDFVEIGYFWQSTEMQQTEFSFWALLGSPLIVATDVRKARETMPQLFNKQIISISQDPLGRVADLRNGDDDPDAAQIWTRPLVNVRFAAIVYNNNLLIGKKSAILTWTDTLFPGWPSSSSTSSRANVTDLWTGKQVAVAASSFPVTDLRPRHSRSFLIEPVY